MNALNWLVVVLVILCLYIYRTIKKYPPGPFPLPFIGNLFQIDLAAPHHTILSWSKKYGSVFTFWIGNDPNIMINDYNTLKEYVVKKGEVFTGRPSNYVFEIFNKGYGIGFTEGAHWKEQRRFALHALRDIGFGKTIMEDKIHEQIDSLMQSIQDIFNAAGNAEEAVLNPIHPLRLAVGNIILSVIIGLKYKKNNQVMEQLIKAFETNQEIMMHPLTQLLSVYPFLGKIPLFSHFNKDIIVETSDIFQNWASERIKEHKQMLNNDDETTDFTQAFLKEMKTKNEKNQDLGTFTEQQLIGVILDLYGAGMDTTVTTLRWAILFLLHNPDVQTKVQDEIDCVVGKEGRINMQHRVDMPYTVATINEVLRLGNILPINLQHKTTQDITINGYDIPKGTTVVPQMASVHIDPEMFTDPLVFNPDRFINNQSNKDKLETVMAFSMGKRQCLGESLARMELFLIFCAIFQKFTIKPISNAQLPSLKGDFKFMNMPKPYECVFVKRSS